VRGALLAGLCALALLALAAPAQAYWQAPGAGTGSAVSATMPTAGTPTAAVSGRNVTVTWAQNTFQGDRLGSYAGGGYKLKRYAPGSSTPVSPNASCATTIGGTGPTLECVETEVPAGDWQYTATPVLNTFTGNEGSRSATVTLAVSPPANSELPVISGTARQGQTLSTSTGTWANSPTSYGYQWRACDSLGANCANITGATSSTYVLTTAEVGKTIRVIVTATNAGGSTSATAAATAVTVP
jgi:hypothetical protein